MILEIWVYFGEFFDLAWGNFIQKNVSSGGDSSQECQSRKD